MGYTTTFRGVFRTDKPMTPAHLAYISRFSDTRRMTRDASKTALLPDPIREAVGLPVGVEGSYYVGGQGYRGQDKTSDVIDGNAPPDGQPGLWCKWSIAADSGDDDFTDPTVICWNGLEKFHFYVEWITYLIDHFLTTWGYVLNGTVRWEGEESGDIGAIVVENNVVRTVEPCHHGLPDSTD